jgi:outer membrane protein OmpA-like peptidoglycan-associated protein
MAGLAERASTQEGAQDLLSTFKGGQYPHLDPSELGRAVADPDTAAGVARSSEGFLSRLFGNKQRGVVDGLASSAGVSPSSASKLLGLALPMVLGFVGKQAVSRNMDASGLRGFLSSQRRGMGDVLPGSLSGLVGGGAEPRAGVSGRHPIDYAGAVPTHKTRIGPWVVLALAIAAALALLMVTRGARRGVTNDARTHQAEQLGNVARPQALHAGGVTALSQAMSGGQALPQRFVLSDLTFRTDSAEIDPTSAAVLDDVAQAMTANPTARIRVEGHTDNTGAADTNQALSQSRAESTRAYLASKGIDSARIDAVGHGADQPLTSNDRPEGRAQNRRTEIVVVQQ